MKIVVSDTKYMLDGIEGELNIAEEKISEFEDMVMGNYLKWNFFF